MKETFGFASFWKSGVFQTSSIHARVRLELRYEEKERRKIIRRGEEKRKKEDGVRWVQGPSLREMLRKETSVSAANKNETRALAKIAPQRNACPESRRTAYAHRYIPGRHIRMYSRIRVSVLILLLLTSYKRKKYRLMLRRNVAPSSYRILFLSFMTISSQIRKR